MNSAVFPSVLSARLILEDGSVFVGRSVGATGTSTGEVCFNTSMTGYQEILTDPSYHGQIVCLTTAEVGVTGFNPEDFESRKIQVAGFVVRRLTEQPSNWRATQSLGDALRQAGVVAIDGIDTRALTRHLRVRGTMRGTISTDIAASTDDLLETARESAGVVGQDFTRLVTRPELADWTEALDGKKWYDLAKAPIHTADGPANKTTTTAANTAGRTLHVVVVDYGLKSSIARHLTERGCKVTIVPATATAAEILALNPDGVLLSNGPGDPAACESAVTELRRLLAANTPIGGICLGFQLAALACGASTMKLPFGHRGANHPVMALDTGRTLVTSQNHGFAVRRETLDRAGLTLTHISLNDGTAEGFRHRSHPLMAVQYHPEAAPGPHDAHDDFFDRFLDMLATHRPAASPTE